VAIVGEDRVLCETVLNVEVTHSERLLPAVDRALGEARVALDALDGIAVSIGPGSFTGLRIGLSTAKGLAYATGLPLVGVPTLEAMAWALPAARWQICPVLDARKQEVYAALFRHGTDGLRRITDDAAMSPEQLCRLIRNPTLFLGDGIGPYGGLLRERLGEKMLLPPVAGRGPRPACVAELGRRRLLRGERDAVESLAPRYLRPSEAELRHRRDAYR
jgi:tRNA threonylcarbamoyladenosine biosynthesis protein TsaB